MKHLARWLESEFEYRVPLPYLLLGMAGTIPCFAAVPAEATFGMGQDAQKGGLAIALYIFLALVAWLPTEIFLWRTRKRVSVRPFHAVAVKGRLAETIGPQAQALDEAAADLEQIKTLLRANSLDGPTSKRLLEASKARMRRMFELSVAAPALYGLSRDAAGEQIAEDGTWLEEARRLLESDPIQGPALDEGHELLAELKAESKAREEAIQELLA